MKTWYFNLALAMCLTLFTIGAVCAIGAVSRPDLIINDKDMVSVIAFLGDKDQIAAGGADGIIRIYDLSSGQLVKELRGHDGAILSIKYSGKKLVSGSADKTVIVWDLIKYKPLNILKGHKGQVRAVAISPDGKVVASGSSDKSIRLWDSNSGRPLNSLEKHTDTITALDFSPDGDYLVSGANDQTIKLWEVVAGHIEKDMPVEIYPILRLKYTPDGKNVIYGGGNSTLGMVDIEEWKISKIPWDASGIRSIDISADCKNILTGDSHRNICLWRAKDGKLITVLKGHNGKVDTVEFSNKSNRIISGADDKKIMLWSIP